MAKGSLNGSPGGNYRWQPTLAAARHELGCDRPVGDLHGTDSLGQDRQLQLPGVDHRHTVSAAHPRMPGASR